MPAKAPDREARITTLIAKLEATDRLLEHAELFGDLGRGVSLWAAGSREAMETEIAALAKEVLERVLVASMGSSTPREELTAASENLARAHLVRASGQPHQLVRLLYNLREIDAAVDTLAPPKPEGRRVTGPRIPLRGRS